MDITAAAGQPRPGTSRPAQRKRAFHTRFLAGAPAMTAAGRIAKRVKLPVRHAATAPIVPPAEQASSNMPLHTTGQLES